MQMVPSLALTGRFGLILLLAAVVTIFSGMDAKQASAATSSIVIEGKDGTVIDGVRVSSRNGDCVVIRESTNVIIRNSIIGPCKGRGIFIEGGGHNTVAGNTIQTQYKPRECCDTGSGILALRTEGLVIDSNNIAYSETNIELLAVTNATVTNNSLVNPLGPFPRGQQIQVAGGHGLPESRDVVIESNTMVASKAPIYNFRENQEDAVNLYFARDVAVRSNQISGGSSASGCGILADDGANGTTITGNRLHDTGQCGIGVASGRSHVVDGNRVLLTREVTGGGNVAIYVWNQYEAPCGGVEVTDNIATFRKADGSYNSYHDGGGCDAISLSENTFDAEAYRILQPEFTSPEDAVLPPQFFPLEHPAGRSITSKVEIEVVIVALTAAAAAAGLYLLGRRRGSRTTRSI